MQVSNKIDIYEINDEELPIGKNEEMIIESHWNDDDLIVLKIENKSYTVRARQLGVAIKNATNWDR